MNKINRILMGLALSVNLVAYAGGCSYDNISLTVYNNTDQSLSPQPPTLTPQPQTLGAAYVYGTLNISPSESPITIAPGDSFSYQGCGIAETYTESIAAVGPFVFVQEHQQGGNFPLMQNYLQYTSPSSTWRADGAPNNYIWYVFGPGPSDANSDNFETSIVGSTNSTEPSDCNPQLGVCAYFLMSHCGESRGGCNQQAFFWINSLPPPMAQPLGGTT